MRNMHTSMEQNRPLGHCSNFYSWHFTVIGLTTENTMLRTEY